MSRFILIALLFCFRNISAQDTLTYATFTDTQYKAWKTIEQNWLHERYYPFLKKEKIKLSCASCTTASVWVMFEKKEGETTFSLLKNVKCGRQFEGKQLSSLKKLMGEIKLPEEFNNTKIKVLLGLALKC